MYAVPILFFVLLYYLNPAFGRFQMPHLNASQRIIQFLCDGPHLLHPTGKDVFLVMIDHLAYGGDHCRRAAQAAL